MKNLIALLLSALSISVVVAQATGESNFRIIRQQAHEVVMRLDLMGVRKAFVQTPRGEAVLPLFEDGTPLLQTGSPELPKYATALMIPATGSMALEVLDVAYRDFDNVEIAPSKGDFKRNIDPASVPFMYGDAYARDAFFPSQLADLQQPFIMRDARGQAVWIYPVQYNPVRKIMRVYSHITLRAYHTDAPGKNEILQPGNRPQSRTFEQLYRHIFANADQTTASRGGGGLAPEKMLVIARDEFEEALEPLLVWKRQSGIQTILVKKSEINLAQPGALYNFTKKYYEEEGITYLLLVGDADAFTPEFRTSGGTNYACDPCFGYMEGDDHLPEVLVGRFHAATVEQLKIMVNRNLRYEKSPLADTAYNWCETGIWAASNEGKDIGDDNQADFEHANEWKSRQLQSGYTQYWEFYDGNHASISPTPGDETADKIGNPVNGDVLKVLNERGAGIFNYTGHGWEQGLVSSNFNTDAVKKMRNDQAYPFLIAVACCTGNFTNNTGGDCLGEAWQRAGDLSNGTPWGGIAGFFSSDFQSWAPPMEGQDAMNEMMERSENQNLVPTFSSLLAYGNAKMIVAYDASGEAMADFWNPFLEPNTMPRTRLPKPLEAAHESEVFLGQNALTVTSPVEGALVSLLWKGEVLAVALVENGSANLQFDGLADVGNITVTATHRNRIPYQGKIAVRPLSGPFVVNTALVLDDSAGNNNQKADYGETISLNLTLANVGLEKATDAKAVLSSTSPLVAILDGEEAFGDLVAGADSAKNAAFSFKVNPFVTNGVQANFDLKIEYSGGKIFHTSLKVKLLAPVMAIGKIKISDQLGGDNDGHLESGETGRIIIENFNTGASLSPEAVGVLKCNLPWLQIGAPAQMGKLVAGGVITETQFVVIVPPNSPLVEEAVFEYVLTGGAYKAEKAFAPVIINPIIETFESKNFTGFPWAMSGNKPWLITTPQAGGGKYSARSGTITHNEQSVMSLRLEFAKGGQVKFFRRVSCEPEFDFLVFYIDSVEQAVWSGDVPWSEVSFPITAGVHQLTWAYKKDELGTSGTDRAWVDEVSLPPYKVLVGTDLGQLNADALHVFPNPSDNLLNVTGQIIESQGVVQISLFDVQGRLVQMPTKQPLVSDGYFNAVLDMHTLRAGVYFLQVNTGQKSVCRKVIKN